MIRIDIKPEMSAERLSWPDAEVIAGQLAEARTPDKQHVVWARRRPKEGEL